MLKTVEYINWQQQINQMCINTNIKTVVIDREGKVGKNMEIC